MTFLRIRKAKGGVFSDDGFAGKEKRRRRARCSRAPRRKPDGYTSPASTLIDMPVPVEPTGVLEFAAAQSMTSSAIP